VYKSRSNALLMSSSCYLVCLRVLSLRVWR